MSSELVLFHEGLSTDTRAALQKPGFLKSVENILLEIDGKQSLRPFFGAINSTPLGAIETIKAWRDLVLVADGTHLRATSNNSNFTDLYGTFASAPWQFKVYKDFISATNGTDFVLVDEDKNLYPAQIESPTTAPSGVGNGATVGGPNGTYKLYVSYFITWPNGHTFETGLSPIGADVTVVSKHITWSSIPLCPYAALFGANPTLYRNLYRGPGTGGALTEIWYVATITDNVTTTYDDGYSDATLQAGYVETNALYVPSIIPKYHEWHYGRLFMIDSTYKWRHYYTEVALGNTAEANEQLMPLAITELNWDDLRVAGFDDVDPQGVVSWGTYLYIALKQTWIRKQGDNPNTWAYRKTYSTLGIGAPWTIDTSSMGIFGVTNPENGEAGLAIFNGQYSEVLTSPRLDEFFKTEINLDQIGQCRGRVAGKYYFLLYPSTGQTTPNRVLAVDLRRYPQIRVAHWTDLYGRSLDTDHQGQRFYFGGSDGYVRQKEATGTSDFKIETHDLMGGDPKVINEVKTWKELKFALDSGSADVTLQVYIDDILMKWPDGTTEKTLSGSSEAVQYLRNLPTNWQGYRMRLLLTGINLTSFTLYAPWKLDFEVKV